MIAPRKISNLKTREYDNEAWSKSVAFPQQAIELPKPRHSHCAVDLHGPSSALGWSHPTAILQKFRSISIRAGIISGWSSELEDPIKLPEHADYATRRYDISTGPGLET
jgi:hypothetical protein